MHRHHIQALSSAEGEQLALTEVEADLLCDYCSLEVPVYVLYREHKGSVG